MKTHGKLIAIEGIDGSGKRTQVQLLEQELAARGHDTYATGFPQYDSWFGTMVGQFLNGEFGPLDRVDPRFTALLYAGDRFEAKEKIVAALAQGCIVLADRYIASNMAHQTARVPPDKRSEFVSWLEHLEYRIYGLPLEALVIYLRVPPAQAQTLIERKTPRAYTSSKQDLQEASLAHLEAAAGMYDFLAARTSWVTVECFDAGRGEMRSKQEIAVEILAAIENILTRPPSGEST